MSSFNGKYAIVICLLVSLMSQCGTRKGTNGQEGNAVISCSEITVGILDNLGTEPLTPLVVLSDSIRLIPPDACGWNGNYPGRTFNHQSTNYRYAFFGKTGPWDLDEEDDMEPFPPVPGLAKGWLSVYCARDTCFASRVVLALRCPEVETLTTWMSGRVKDYLEDCPVKDKNDDTSATTIPMCPSWTEMRTPSGSSTLLLCFHYLHALEVLFGHMRCPEPDPEWDGGYQQPAEQAGLMLFDCWRAGDMYTFYEATWYDWMSCGDNTTEAYRTVDTRTGKELSLEDFVDEEDYGRFAQILMTHLTKDAGKRAEALENYAADGSEIMLLVDGCGLVKEGLVVYFYPYTLAAGAYGQFNAIIPLNELKGMMKGED